jgi:hypothetical protein
MRPRARVARLVAGDAALGRAERRSCRLLREPEKQRDPERPGKRRGEQREDR